jgi:hypothetical protein
VQRHPKQGMTKRSPLQDMDVDEMKLQRRWESRSDIDQYSDGFVSCRSATTSHCRKGNTKDICLELEGALKGKCLEDDVYFGRSSSMD